MPSDLDDLHDELRSVARHLLARSRSAADSDGWPVGADWNLLADAGWLGLEVPEMLDGAGATFAEIGVVLQEMGRAVNRSPFFGSVVLGVGALGLVEPTARSDDLRRRLATGLVVIAVAIADGALDQVGGVPPYRVESSPGGLRLHGRADFVPDAGDASELLLLATGPAGHPVLVLVDPKAPGLVVTDQPVLDATRRVAAVAAQDVPVDHGSVLTFAGDAAAGSARLHDRAALAVAHDSLGVSRAMLDATVEYVGSRRQFDRPIGSFQAVKHACADMLVDVVVAERLVDAASEALVADDPGAGVAVSMAKARTSEAAVRNAGKAMQLHGGIGYTWESGIHVFLKRAALDRSLFGSPAAHRRRIAARYTG
jgi:alkylation response protein AidB-like acyl-CoA dehydrogenase